MDDKKWTHLDFECLSSDADGYCIGVVGRDAAGVRYHTLIPVDVAATMLPLPGQRRSLHAFGEIAIRVDQIRDSLLSGALRGPMTSIPEDLSGELTQLRLAVHASAPSRKLAAPVLDELNRIACELYRRCPPSLPPFPR